MTSALEAETMTNRETSPTLQLTTDEHTSMKRAMSRKPRRFALSGQDSHALEPRHLLTTVNVGSLTGLVPLPNHASLTIGHAVAHATHTPASVGVHAAFTTGTSNHATARYLQRQAATDHSTSTLAIHPSAPKHARAATPSHAA